MIEGAKAPSIEKYGGLAERSKAPVLKIGDPKGSLGSNPRASATKLNREDDVYIMGQYNRDVSYRKALRKRRLADRIYRCWHDDDWHYYDNLHQYSKNKIHCSCPMCSTKTRNKGDRRNKRKNYSRSINYRRADLRRMIDMDQDLEDTIGTLSKRRVKEWI